MLEANNWVSRQLHLCGCVTQFDLRWWGSVTVKECAGHARIRAVYLGGNDA